MKCSRSGLTLVIFVLGLCLPGVARAQGDRVGILSIETEGVSDAAAELLEAEVEEALEGVGMRSVGRDELRKSLAGSDFMEDCLFGPCLATLREVTQIPIVLVAKIRGEGSNYTFIITLIDTTKGIPTIQISEACAVCTIEEAISTATLSTISLLTGTGDAEVAQPGGRGRGNSAVTDDRSDSKSRRLGSRIRRSGLIFLGVGVASALTGAYLWREEKRQTGIAGMAVGGALLTGGTTMLLLSRRF